MGITPTLLSQLFPRLYHMAEEGTWDSIREHGLLSTSALLDLYEISGQERREIESEHRPESLPIEHLRYGSAVIRDQKPMRESSLRACLEGLTPPEWYKILNRKVFFWLTWERLTRLLSARAYRSQTHCVITVDAAQLLERHAKRIRLSPINSGSTLFNPQPRGRDTFLPLEQYPFQQWQKKRGGAKNAIAELTVEHQVPDIAEIAIRAAHMKGSQETEVLFQR
jgi:hypothetical protein